MKHPFFAVLLTLGLASAAAQSPADCVDLFISAPAIRERSRPTG